jgi:hypothetical protein
VSAEFCRRGSETKSHILTSKRLKRSSRHRIRDCRCSSHPHPASRYMADETGDNDAKRRSELDLAARHVLASSTES